MVQIKIINESKYPLPAYATPQSAGMDLYANIDEPITLDTLERKLIPTGIRIQLPVGYEAQIRPRSGLALKHGIGLSNHIGTVDSDYTGQIGAIVVNLSKEKYTIQPGERIAQMVIAKHEVADFIEVEELDKTERGDGGYGHTGKK